MSERVMPRDALVEMAAVTNDQSLLTVWNPDTDANDKIKLETVKEFTSEGVDIKDVALNQNVIPANISEAYDNEILDGDKIIAGANWTSVNTCLSELVDIYFKGSQFSKLTNGTAASSRMEQDKTTSFNNLIQTGSFVVKLGDPGGDIVRLDIANITAGGSIFFSTFNFGNYPNSPGTPTDGIISKYIWHDVKTLEIFLECDSLDALTDDVKIRTYAASGATIDNYSYWTRMQLVDKPEVVLWPFINGSKTADVINKEFTMPDSFFFDCEIEPRFIFDTTIAHKIYEWRLGGLLEFRLNYNAGVDKWNIVWEDNGEAQASLISQQFNLDGSGGLTKLNQKMRLAGLMKLATGGINDSRFITLPLEIGDIFEDTSWNLTPATKDSDFPILAIAHEAGSSQGNMIIKYLRFYADDGSFDGDVTNNNDLDNMVAGKTPLFSATSSPTVDRDSIDENTNTQNAIEKNASSIQLLKSFDNWHEVGGTNEPVFLNGWVDEGSGIYSKASFYKDSSGWVHLKGTIKSGTVGVAAFILPNGYLPADRLQKRFPVNSNSTYGMVQIGSNGSVTILSPSTNTQLFLDGISFYAGF